VFVIRADKSGMTVERTQVETGESRDGKVAILRGITAGAQVVAVGQNRLRNGMRVEIVPDDTLQRASADSD
jgi:membrane fusion protein (multidrug efflux system)